MGPRFGIKLPPCGYLGSRYFMASPSVPFMSYPQLMLMVIFGAGASYDSVSPADLVPRVDPALRPPLAKDLFANGPVQGDAINRYQQVRAVVPRLRAASTEGPTIERELEAIQAEAKSMPTHYQILVALRYYFRHLLHTCGSEWHKFANGVTNYVRLLYRLEQWRVRSKSDVCLVSFNYDTLLDSACRDVLQMDLTQTGHYISYDNYKIIKPHGSVNWGVRLDHVLDRSMKDNEIEQKVIALGNKLQPSNDIYATMGQSIRNPMDSTTSSPLVPAIAIPMEQKSEAHFVCPKNHLEHLRRAIAKTDHLLVIGWRGNEEHFLSLWDEKSPWLRRVLIVSGSDTHDIAENFNRPGMIGTGCEVSDYKDGFSNFLATAELETFLTSLD